MRNTNGFTLLELLVACTISMTVLISVFGFAMKVFGGFDRMVRTERERQELSFAADTMREHLWVGVRGAEATSEVCTLKDAMGREVSFYLKDKKVCLYKNATFYLTTGVFPIAYMSFNYQPDTVLFQLESGACYRYHL